MSSSSINQLNEIVKKEIWPELINDLWSTQSSFFQFVQGRSPNFKFGFSGFKPFYDQADLKEEQIVEKMFFISISDSMDDYNYTNVCESCSEELDTKILEIEEKRFAVCQFCFNYLKGQGILS